MKKPKRPRAKAKKRQPPRKPDTIAASPTKPEPPSFRGSVLLWLTAMFAALSLFGGMQVFLDLADWAHVFVDSWRTWTLVFWTKVGALLGVSKIHPLTAIVLTFITCMAPISFAAARLDDQALSPTNKSLWAYLSSWEFIYGACTGVATAFGAVVIYCFAVDYFIAGRKLIGDFPIAFSMGLTGAYFVVWLVCVAKISGSSTAGHMLLLALFVALFYFLLTAQVLHAQGEEADIDRITLLRFSLIWIPLNIAGLLSWVRPQFYNYRFTMVLLSLGFLVLLNYVSLLGISLKAK